LRDIFFLRKPGTDIYSPQALWSSSSEKKNGCRSRFCVLAEKREPEELNKQKNKLGQRAESSFFAPEDAEVKRAGGNEKIARFDLRVRSSVE